MKIAIIGAGISGLSSAYFLSRHHEVTVYERSHRLGGHTATEGVDYDGRHFAIDTGFIVYNERTYPLFVRLLRELGVRTQASAMGFSVSCQNTGFEYAGTNANALFAQRKNALSKSFWRMLADIVRFNRQAQRDLKLGLIDEALTLGEYLQQGAYSRRFSEHYLIPMGAAIWSASLKQMQAMPALFFVRFFFNHGLLTVSDQPQWRVIAGGSAAYLPPLTRTFADRIHTSANIESVSRSENTVHVHFKDAQTEIFDALVIATHSDQALALLADASENERAILGSIRYQENTVVLHHDERLLPRSKRCWASWNYRLGGGDSALPSLTYNMNLLQNIDCKRTFCVTLNDDAIDPEKILGRFRYAHPQFDAEAVRAQRRYAEINGVQNTYFCGAYWGNGFHEDGVRSALAVAEAMGLGWP